MSHQVRSSFLPLL
ncbi:hypothetical protein E2C01_074871 [Portunus trituberculatus]|uniref:Uncharacterized protein n=1 Tax=Portunus trituberculatus TaxID=210409 RepID=A0A5B7IIC6_PORTR|nr:hypothetical protein [Portunus trituberculatus]